LPSTQNRADRAGRQVFFVFAKRQLVYVALREGELAVEIQAAPIPPGIDVEVESRVLGLHAHGLGVRERRGEREATREALIQFGLQGVVTWSYSPRSDFNAGLFPKSWFKG